MRWQFENHHDRFAKNIPTVLAYLGGMKGTEKLERQYGLFFPRCIKCGKKTTMPGDMNDKELFGLCRTCQSPILRERNRKKEELRARRGRLLALQMLPHNVVADIDETGYTRVAPHPGVEYLLSFTGKIYNVTTSQDYCFHHRTPASQWDRVVHFWILLSRHFPLVESTAHKRNLPKEGWMKSNTYDKIKIKRR